MFKKGFIFGLLGFFVSLITISLTSTDKKSTPEGSASFTYKDGINGWISFGNILEESISQAFLSKDDLFVSMFMWKTMEPIHIPNKPEIIITDENNSIFWTNGTKQKGTTYTGWKQDGKDQNVLNSESLSIVKIDIISNDRRIGGYLYLEIENKPNPKDFIVAGWQYYGSVFSSSNDIRSYVANEDRLGIKNFVDKVTKKEDIIDLTILAKNNIAIWDTDNAKIGKKLQNGGWVNQEKDKNESDRFYFSIPVKYQERELADIHFLIKLPSPKGNTYLSGIIGKINNLFKVKSLMPSVIAFLIFFFVGGVLSKGSGGGTTVVKKVSAKGTPELENKIQQLKEEIEQLEVTKADVMETVAKKQKIQKDLSMEIEALEKKKESIPAEAAAGMGPLAGEEESEESLLFDDLLGEKSKTIAQKKEELELTQRIVAKRREEIDLSGKIESRRRELLDLEQKIEKLNGK